MGQRDGNCNSSSGKSDTLSDIHASKKPMHIKKNKKESLDIPEDRHPTSKRENVQ